MSTNHITAEWIEGAHHIALVDVAQGVGVGIADAGEEVPYWSLWQSRRHLDIELRIVGMAVVALLPRGHFVCGRAPSSLGASKEFGDDYTLPALRDLLGPASSPLWEPDALPVFADGLLHVEGHPALADLWVELLGE